MIALRGLAILLLPQAAGEAPTHALGLPVALAALLISFLFCWIGRVP